MTDPDTCAVCGAPIPPPPPDGAVDPRTGASLHDPNWEPTACPGCQPDPADSVRDRISFRPSGASRWMACPASIRLSVGTESHTTPEAEEGIQAHRLAAAAATLGPERWRALLPVEGWPEDMVDAATFWTEMLHSPVWADDIRIEQRLVLRPPAGFDLPEIRGTADAVSVSKDGKLGSVADLKFGRGIYVSAENNPQLLIYGAALLQAEPSLEKVELIIFQPRWGEDTLRSVVMDRAELEERAGAILTAAASWREAEAQPGAHCRWCPAIARCEEAQRVGAALSHEGRARLAAMESDRPEQEDVDGLAKWLANHQGTLRAVLRAAEGRLTEELQDGVDVPGWTLSQGWGPRKWKRGTTVEDLRAIGFDPTADPPLPSVTTVERALRGGRKKVAGLVERNPTRPRLEPVVFERT